jgi:hypothetical protein
MILIAGLAFVINRRGLALIAAWGPFFMWFCTGVILTITTTNSPGDAGGPIILLSVIGGLLLGRDGIIASVALSLSVLLLRWVGIEAYLDGEGTPSVPNVVMQVTVGSLIVYLFLRYTVIARIAAASDAVKSREVTGDIDEGEDCSIAPSAWRVAMFASVRPSSRKTSVVCSPANGARDTGPLSAAEK